MRQLSVVAFLALPFILSADDLVKPDKLPLNTWVREDIFAGYLAEDVAALDRGEKKVDLYLQSHPDDNTANAWKYGILLFRMRQAVKKGDLAEYKSRQAASMEFKTKGLKNLPADLVGPNIIVGGSQILMAVFLPEQDREALYREGRALLSQVPTIQAKFFDTLPPHMRGELWSQMALASDRLGDKAERDRVLGEMVEKLKGSPYESRARRWQKQTEIKSQADHTCISCHDPGRLEPTLARLAK